MSALDIYQAYIAWLGGGKPVPLQRLLDCPFANKDIFEDESKLVNYLFYFVPDISGPVPRCFFFFEENTFLKDEVGDLVLLHSSYRLFDS